jgi:hypothetical protein
LKCRNFAFRVFVFSRVPHFFAEEESRMRSVRVLLSFALISLSTLCVAQSDASKTFDKLKTLAGSWEATVTTAPPTPDVVGKHAQVWLRVTSMGNALMHEMKVEGRPDDPITMFYLDSDRLFLTHYCDAGNRPRMTATTSADGKTVDFDFLDVAGSLQYGHMHHVTFTFIDENHHSEDWTFMSPDNKNSIRAHLDLQRTK